MIIAVISLLIQDGIQIDIINNHFCGEPASSLLALRFTVLLREAGSFVFLHGWLLLDILVLAPMSPP